MSPNTTNWDIFHEFLILFYFAEFDGGFQTENQTDAEFSCTQDNSHF